MSVILSVILSATAMANLTGAGKAWLGVGTPVFRLGRLYSSVVGVWLGRPAWVPPTAIGRCAQRPLSRLLRLLGNPASDANTVVCTGTHDNNTSQGWWLEAFDAERQHVRDCLGLTPQNELEIHWRLITAACASVADSAIHPMQDVLGLDGSSRMNAHSTVQLQKERSEHESL